MADRQQQLLPIAEAEGTYAERRARVGNALKLVDANLHLAWFVLKVFESTGGGFSNVPPLRMSYEQLASSPFGLCASRDTAMRTVARAVRLGIVTTGQVSRSGQEPNEYRLDWEGILGLLGLRQGTVTGQSTSRNNWSQNATSTKDWSQIATSKTDWLQNATSKTHQSGPPGDPNGPHAGARASCLMSLCLNDVDDVDIRQRLTQKINAIRRQLIPSPKFPSDAQWLICSAVLIAESLGDEWLDGAVSATMKGMHRTAKPVTEPMGYLRSALAMRLYETCGVCEKDEARAALADLMRQVRPAVAKMIGTGGKPEDKNEKTRKGESSV